MPTTKSAKKRHRQSLERRAVNRSTKSAIKTQIRKVREGEEGEEGAEGAAAPPAEEKEKKPPKAPEK